jgi:hypothetical protein
MFKAREDKEFPEFKHLNHAVYLDNIYKFSPALQTDIVSITKTDVLKMFREIIAVYSENQTKLVITLSGQNAEFVNVKSHTETIEL